MKKAFKLFAVTTIVLVFAALATICTYADSTSIRESESNNTPSTADVMLTDECQNMLSSVNYSYIGYSGDVDYFKFSAPRHGRLRIYFSSNNSTDYKCQVLSSSQAVLATVNKFDSQTIVTLKTSPLTDYYLKVYSPSNQYNSSYAYTISICYEAYFEHDWVLPLDPQYMVATSFCGYDALAYNPDGGVPYHMGSDFATSGISGANIYSMCDGTVISSGYSSSMGYYVIIRSNDIDSFTGNPFTVRYMHMITSPSVSTGQTVYAGDIIGYVGNTGESLGTHLHIDINTNGYTTGAQLRANKESVVNPIDFFSEQFYYIMGDIY